MYIGIVFVLWKINCYSIGNMAGHFLGLLSLFPFTNQDWGFCGWLSIEYTMRDHVYTEYDTKNGFWELWQMANQDISGIHVLNSIKGTPIRKQLIHLVYKYLISVSSCDSKKEVWWNASSTPFSQFLRSTYFY